MNEVVPVSVIAQGGELYAKRCVCGTRTTSPALVRVAANGTHKEIASMSRQQKSCAVLAVCFPRNAGWSLGFNPL